ncbi:hypothetical protein H8959_017067 [Pygathrix nigripes]
MGGRRDRGGGAWRGALPSGGPPALERGEQCLTASRGITARSSSLLPIPSLPAARHPDPLIPVPCPGLFDQEGSGVCVRPARDESGFLGAPAIVLPGGAFLYPTGPGGRRRSEMEVNGAAGGGGGPREKPQCFYGSSPHHLEDPSLSELENFSSEIISFKSMEDLVNEFDEKLNVCFRNYNAKTENLAPVKNQLQIQEEEETLQDEEVWDALTDNYIPSLSEDWRDPNIEALNGNCSDTEIHEKEEEEFNEKSENDSGINEEPLLTADQVIEEIEEMMQNSPDPEEEEEVLEEED